MSNPLYSAIFHVASALEIPVVAGALLALAFVVVEIGRFLVEIRSRQRRRPGLRRTRELERTALAARAAISSASPGATPGPIATALAPVAWSADMERAYTAFAAHAPGAEIDGGSGVAKDLADFDLACERRLARTRLLVRVGPALGLMGTLIPLSPALEGLASGKVQALTDNLRVAFSVTVLGLLVGALAFALSLVRESMYGQDYSDLEYVASILTGSDGAAATADGQQGALEPAPRSEDPIS